MAETLGFPVPLRQRFRPLSITCPGFLTTCLQRRRRIAETALVCEADPANYSPMIPLMPQMFPMLQMLFAPVPLILLDLPEPTQATLLVTKFRVSREGPSPSLEIV